LTPIEYKSLISIGGRHLPPTDAFIKQLLKKTKVDILGIDNSQKFEYFVTKNILANCQHHYCHQYFA
jgi:hypothetical protein